MKHFERAGLLLCVTTALLLGCSDHPSANSPKVIGGQPADAAKLPVVALIKPDSEGIPYSFCSGTLLTPTIVLTAAHCSVDSKDHVYEVSKLGVVVGHSQPEQVIDQRIAVAKVTPHPQFQRDKMGKDSDGSVRLNEAYDIALWELAKPAKGTVLATVLSLESVSAVFTDQAKLTLAGYGQKSAWDSPWTAHELAAAETPFRTQYKQKTSVLKVNENGRSIRKTEIIELPALAATEFYAGGFGEPDTCKGDSGGPVFARTGTGDLRVVGVTSRGSGTCEEGGVYTLVPAFTDWLKSLAGTDLKVAP